MAHNAHAVQSPPPPGSYAAYVDLDKHKSDRLKLLGCINRYRERYGQTPAVALVNPLQAEVGEIGVAVTADPHVPVNAFWLGEVPA